MRDGHWAGNRELFSVRGVGVLNASEAGALWVLRRALHAEKVHLDAAMFEMASTSERGPRQPFSFWVSDSRVSAKDLAIPMI